MPQISRVRAREVLDSRGNPTVEAEIHLASGRGGRAIAPSGASTGRHEAHELRDGDPGCFEGRRVLRAVANVNEIIGPALQGIDVRQQALIDQTMIALDGTPNKSRLGANAILAVSLACAQAAAQSEGVWLFQYLDVGGRARLPLPMVNMISGGRHAGGQIAFQDFLLLPIGAESFCQSLSMAVQVYGALGRRLIKCGFEGNLVGDEGGYGPRLPSNRAAVEMLVQAIEDAELEPGKDAAIAIDVASTQFYHNGIYDFSECGARAGGTHLEVIAIYEEWARQYPLLSIEDGLAEDDWDGWRELTSRLGTRMQLVGDDLFVTSPDRLARGVREEVGNAILIKMNQIGTLTETLEVVERARQSGYAAVISARSGETEDTSMADLAVATGAGQIKIGGVARSERLAKYNQLLRIEEMLGPFPPYAGRAALAPLR